MSDNLPLMPFPSTPSRGMYPVNLKLAMRDALTSSETPLTSYMSTTNSSSIETRATTYEELIQSLDAQADILQYLPSEAEVDELFDEIHGESLLNSSSRRSSTPKLAFGTYREDGINVAQVYVYLRSPSFKNTEPSMMFGKCLANTKYTVMNTKDINCTDGMFEANKFWIPLIENGKVAFDAVKAVLKALFIRKGITLSTPIPVVGSAFRSKLVLGCEMFRSFKQSRKSLEKTPPKEVDKSMSAIDGSSAQSSSPAISDISSTTSPVTSTAHMYSRNELNSHMGANRPLVVDSSKKHRVSELTTTEQNTIKAETNKDVAVSKLAALDGLNSDTLFIPENHQKELEEELPEELEEEIEESSASKTTTPECNKGIKIILESLSASYDDRKDLEKKIDEMSAQVARHIATLEELRRERERFEAEYERKRQALEERISVEDQDRVSRIAEIEASSQTIQEKLEVEKRQLGVMTPEMVAVWELSRKFVCKEYGIKEGLPSKRQKTRH
ncbi:hypothetical protein COCSADRAFT_23903 [Bipolaris sorokiniana ND90Pr]|uniref:Uncharacterized protein n=1 Tax=Cochliobolus sativus (strain ND90Pr / ATCC 201652) TaxID=665912 RepID=M2TFM0_COCSN|nr:uncharacterized protein COCSADRAFT_23903 [Bipolaris sorokiniana ND90Pr]EMD67537.1 hypothetical protein COCSADRAFT_23903 [Bipolaris sorokiniana ND90Pr]